MKNDTLLIAAVAGIGLFAISKMIKPAGATMRPPSGGGTASSLNNNGSPPITEIRNSALPGQQGYGWTYYSDGTVIDPNGAYYYNGQRVWTPGAGAMGMGG